MYTCVVGTSAMISCHGLGTKSWRGKIENTHDIHPPPQLSVLEVSAFLTYSHTHILTGGSLRGPPFLNPGRMLTLLTYLNFLTYFSLLHLLTYVLTRPI